MFRKALLAGFLSVWLKKCVVSSPPHNGILSWVLFPAIQLAHGKLLGLLLAMVCCIQRISRHWRKLFVGPQLPREERGRFHPVIGLALGWRCPIHI